MIDSKLPRDKAGLCPLCGRPLHPGLLPPLNTNGFISSDNLDPYPLPSLDQVELGRMWIQKFCRHHRRLNRKNGSYFLKHSIENWDKATAGNIRYVSNGAIIQAFLEEGYICEVFGLNGCFHFEYIGPKVKSKYRGARSRIPYSVEDWRDGLGQMTQSEMG